MSKVYDADIKENKLSPQMEALISRMDEWTVIIEKLENRIDIIEQNMDVAKIRESAMKAQKSALPAKCKLSNLTN